MYVLYVYKDLAYVSHMECSYVANLFRSSGSGLLQEVFISTALLLYLFLIMVSLCVVVAVV